MVKGGKIPEPPQDPETTELDTSKLRSPDEDTSKEPTPIGDAAAKAAGIKIPKGADLTDGKNPDPVALVNPEHLEDDDPMSLAGDFVDEDGDGVDDREQS